MAQTCTTPESSGKIKIVSEQDLCGPCSDAVKQFKELRPNIDVETVMETAIKETIDLREKFPEINLYKAIYNKISLIKTSILINKIKMTPFEMIASKKYQLGSLVVKNFDLENEEYAQKLSDIASLPYEYWDMPEE